MPRYTLSVLLLLLLAACRPDLSLEPFCDPRVLEAGEVRIRRVPCSDELIASGEGRRSDWLLENAAARFIIRDVPDALTRHGAAGGGVVDAVSLTSQDMLTEALPLIGGEWFLPGEAVAEPSDAEEGAVSLTIRGTLPSGAAAEMRYTLAADSPTLQLEGADALSVVPDTGVARIGAAVLEDGVNLLGFSDATLVEDQGGWLTLAGVTALTPGDRSTVHGVLWPDGLPLSRAASGKWLHALADDGETVLARLPISGDQVRGTVPAETAWLQTVADGHLDGMPVSMTSPEEPTIGPFGAVRLAVLDAESGAPLPARLHWQGASFVTLPDPADLDSDLLLTGPGDGWAWIEAGPAYEAARVPLTIAEGETVRRRVRLARAVTPAVLADLAVVTAPDRTERRETRDILAEVAAGGVQYALLVADDEISRGRVGEGAPWTQVVIGSRSTGAGTPSTWSWSANARDPAHGAVDGADLSADDLLAAMSNRGNRSTMVTPAWVALAAPPREWLPYPDLLQIGGLDDLEALVALYDAWQPLPVVGPLAWVEGLDPTAEDFATVDVEAMLAQRRTTATNGPRPVLRVGDLGPGDLDAMPEAPLAVSVSIEAPAWMPLTDAALIGPGGQVYARWALLPGERLEDVSVVLEAPPAWLILACWGEAEPEVPWQAEAPWAVTSPLWLAAP